MTRWGICTTLNAPVDQMLAFVAHHLDLGADHIWLHFDAPDDPALAAARDLPRVTAIACDDAWWHLVRAARPPAHQNRQARNMQRLYAQAPLPWIAHIDHDEFLWPSQPVGAILKDVPKAQPMLRMAPYEALRDPSLPDDIFTARHFRGALRGPDHAADRAQLLGDHAPMLPDGMMSHSVGKCFFRTAIPGLQPRLHGAFSGGVRVPGGAFHPGLMLLHFHAQDRAAWLARLPFRLDRGCYRDRPMQALATMTDAERTAFYDDVQTASPQMIDRLHRLGLLCIADLDLRRKIATLTGAPAT